MEITLAIITVAATIAGNFAAARFSDDLLRSLPKWPRRSA
jgi:hypothetical protein